MSPTANIDMGFKVWFIYFFSLLVQPVLSEMHSNDWLVVEKHLEFCLDILQMRGIVMLLAFFFFFDTKEYMSLFPFPLQKESKTTLQRSWRKGMMINQYRMPELAILRESSKENRVWVARWMKRASAHGWSAPRNRKGSAVQLFWVCLRNAGWVTRMRENFCFVVRLAAEAYRRDPHCCILRGKVTRMNFVATCRRQFRGLNCGWRHDTYCGANSVAFSWLRKGSVSSLITFS